MITILGELGVTLAPILAAAGIGGLAVGFGAQNLVRDVITEFLSHLRIRFVLVTL